MSQEKTININKFYPDNLEIKKITELEKQIVIEMKSHSQNIKCQKCGKEAEKHHGTYIRRVQDLPILGKNVELEITSNEYNCSNVECGQKIFMEEYDEFLSRYDRMTTRCEELVRVIGMETSSEGASKIIRRYATGDPYKMCCFDRNVVKRVNYEDYREDIINYLRHNISFKDICARITVDGI